MVWPRNRHSDKISAASSFLLGLDLEINHGTGDRHIDQPSPEDNAIKITGDTATRMAIMHEPYPQRMIWLFCLWNIRRGR